MSRVSNLKIAFLTLLDFLAPHAGCDVTHPRCNIMWPSNQCDLASTPVHESSSSLSASSDDHGCTGAQNPSRSCSPRRRVNGDQLELAWLMCISGAPACAWNESGSRIRASEPLFVAPHREVHYGGCPGDAGHRKLLASELEEQLGFDLICSNIVMSPRDHREMPLHNLPEDALGDSFVPPLGGPSVALLRERIRRCESHADVFVAPDQFGGHGLFAAASLPIHAYLGEYVGTIVSSVPHASAQSEDNYLMRYPDAAGRRYVSGWRSGSLLRFANHGAPGGDACNACIYCVLCDGSWHMVMLTNRPVACREEICFDYGPQFWAHGRGA